MVGIFTPTSVLVPDNIVYDLQAKYCCSASSFQFNFLSFGTSTSSTVSRAMYSNPSLSGSFCLHSMRSLIEEISVQQTNRKKAFAQFKHELKLSLKRLTMLEGEYFISKRSARLIDC